MRNVRSKETRRTLIATFSRLLLSSRPYETLSVREIAREAGVARSTFYAHFRDKAEILAESLKLPLTPLADCVTEEPPYVELQHALAHIWDNRRLGRSLFQESNRRFVGRTLAAMILKRFKPRRHAARASVAALVVAIAEAQIGTVAAWLFGDISGSIQEIAAVIGGLSSKAAT